MKNTDIATAISRIESSLESHNPDDLMLILHHANESIMNHKSTIEVADIGEAYGLLHMYKEAGFKVVAFSDKEMLDECIRLAKIGVH